MPGDIRGMGRYRHRRMTGMRILIQRHRALAVALLVIALCLKALLPAGYMIGQQAKILTVQICDQQPGAMVLKKLIIPMKGDGGDHGQSSKTDCAYSALSMTSLAGADTALLSLALLFILALGFVPVRSRQFGRTAHLRPPLRGPPLLRS